MEKIIGVYKFINIKNLKVYVGSSRNVYERKRGHINDLKRNDHHSFLLQRSWNKHGKDSFQFEVIEILFDITKLKEREQYWIDFYDAANPEKGYNRSPSAGSNTGIIITEETRGRLRISHLNQKPSVKAVAAAKKALTGVKHPFKLRPWRLKQETRICLCGCGEIFITVHNDPKQFLNPEHRDKARRKPREIRICLCGCFQTFEISSHLPQKYIVGHLKKGEVSKEIRVCICGCNKKFEIRATLPNQYLPGHLQSSRGEKQEKRFCICGCNQVFSCFLNSPQKSIFGHNINTDHKVQNLVREI